MGFLEAMSLAVPRASVKASMRKAAAWMWHRSGLYQQRHRDKVLILAYHRVLSEGEVRRRYVQPGMYVVDHVFEAHVQFLADHFRVLSFADLLNRWNGKCWDEGGRYCVLTFDDGWVDTYQRAYPILQRYGIPATIFLPTSFVGTNTWFWPERISHVLGRPESRRTRAEQVELVARLLGRRLRKGVFEAVSSRRRGGDAGDWIDAVIELCKELEEGALNEFIEELGRIMKVEYPDERLVMNWDEIAEMSQGGMSFGSHSCRHRILTNLSSSEAADEIQDSKRVLLERKLNYVPVFCYPNGSYTNSVRRTVRDCGYAAAVTTRYGFEGPVPNDPFAIHRICVHNDISSTVPLLSFHLSGCLARGTPAGRRRT